MPSGEYAIALWLKLWHAVGNAMSHITAPVAACKFNTRRHPTTMVNFDPSGQNVMHSGQKCLPHSGQKCLPEGVRQSSDPVRISMPRMSFSSLEQPITIIGGGCKNKAMCCNTSILSRSNGLRAITQHKWWHSRAHGQSTLLCRFMQGGMPSHKKIKAND